jgi:hypothetical protein
MVALRDQGAAAVTAKRSLAWPLADVASQQSLIWASAAAITVALAIRVLACFSSQSDWDVYAFALVSRDILDGKLPYDGIFDSKPVGLNYIFAAFESIFGPTTLATQLVAPCAAIVAAFFIWRTSKALAKALSSGDERWFPLAMVAVYLALSTKNDGVSSMSEFVANPFLAAAIDFTLRWRLKLMAPRSATFLVGLAFGLACQVTYLLVPPFAIVAIVCGIILAYDSDALVAKVEVVLTTTLGVAIGFGAVLVPQILWGHIAEYFSLQLRYHEAYREDTDARTIVTNILISAQILIPFAAILVAIATSRDALDFRGRKEASFVTVLVALIVGTTIAIIIPNRFPAHYFLLLLPPLVVLAAVVTLRLPERERLICIGFAVIASALMMARPAVRVVEALWQKNLDDQIAAYVEEHTTAADEFFIFCDSHVPYYLSHRRSASRYVFQIHYLDRSLSDAMATPRQVFFSAMDRNPALVVLGVCSVDFDPAEELARRHYQPATVLHEVTRTVRIFSRPSAQP